MFWKRLVFSTHATINKLSFLNVMDVKGRGKAVIPCKPDSLSSIHTYFVWVSGCLYVCLYVCLFITNKRQNGLIDRAQINLQQNLTFKCKLECKIALTNTRQSNVNWSVRLL